MPQKRIYVDKLNACLMLTLAVVILVAVGLAVALLAKGSSFSSAATTGSSSAVGMDSLKQPCVEGHSKILRSSTSSSTPYSSATDDDDLLSPWDDYRLPSHIFPEVYQLLLHPDLNTGNFTGSVDILVKVTMPTDYFIVHSKLLEITRTVVRSDHGQVSSDIRLRDTLYYAENEYWVVKTFDPVPPGLYHLYFEFKGSLLEGIVGLYRSSYVDGASGEKRFLATTKFQPTYARRAFPCFDEPNFRSQFDVTLVHEKGYVALSNMPPLNTVTREDGLLLTKFEKSVAMPTYLSCFIVCQFEKLTVKTDRGTPFSVYSIPDQVNNTEYALKLGSKIQSYYETYYDINYPLPKQDLIAIPDFVSGAMENWGLITFREVNLLVDPKESSSTDVQRVALVVAHELAHMWFGNLVTMKWWDDLWLNEGFANFLEYQGASIAQPEWHVDEMLADDAVHPVMQLDATANSHPIIQPVDHPDEITQIFDAISYSKGASVLQMLNSFMGSEDFQKGLQSYLRKHSFGNARTVDLWQELTVASSKKLDISTIMDSWTKQMGFPVINVEWSKTDRREVTMTQNRFFLLPTDAKNMNKSESPYGYLWHVPLTYRSHNGVETLWLSGDEKKTFAIEREEGQTIKFNVNQTGFYIVNYEESVWEDFSEQLLHSHRSFSRLDRSNLINDAFNLASGSYLNYSVALHLSQYLINEEDFLPWSTAVSCFSTITQNLKNTDSYILWRRYIFKIVEPLYRKLGWKDEGDHLTRMLRPVILDLLCENGHEECLVEARNQLQAWMDNHLFLPPNLRSVVYRYGISSSVGSSAWEYMWMRYLNATSAQEKTKLLRGLAKTREPWLISRYLQSLKDPAKIRSQDVFSVLRFIASNPVGESMTWDFVRQQWEYFVERFTLNDRYLGRLIPSITSNFADEFRLKEMQAFFHKFSEAGAGTAARKQALDKVRENIDWLQRNKNEISRWLSNQPE